MPDSCQVRDPVESVRSLEGLIESHAAEGESLRRLAPPVQDALLGAGLFRMLLPREHGGLEVSPSTFLAAIEAAARLDGSVAWCLCQGNGCAMIGAYLAPEVGQHIFGGDPRAVVAWGPGKAEARVVSGGYRVTGRLAFASGGRHATWLGCHVPVIETDGSYRLGRDGTPVQVTALFPQSSARWIDTWDVIGLCATGSDDFEIRDLFVPDAHVTIRDRDETRVSAGRLFVMPTMSMYATGFSATAIGIARAMLDALSDLAYSKTPRLASSRLSDNPVFQAELARCEARLRSARALLASEVEAIWKDVVRTGRLPITDRYRIRLAATHGIHEARTVAETVWDQAGATAIRTGSPFERRYRDIRTVTQQLQGRSSHFRTVGAFLLGHPADLSVV